jgi:hypothetical protein
MESIKEITNNNDKKYILHSFKPRYFMEGTVLLLFSVIIICIILYYFFKF